MSRLIMGFYIRRLIFAWIYLTSVVDLHHLDADPVSTFHPDADPDPDPDPDPSFQIKAPFLEKGPK
jgi:hypothetical protein